MGVTSLKRNIVSGNLFSENNASLELLAVGGGAGGAGSASIYGGSGGGGAGGLVYKFDNFNIGSYTVTVGAGGTGGASSGTQRGTSPTDTTISGPAINIVAWAGGLAGPGATAGGSFGGSMGGGSNSIPASFGDTGGSVLGQGNSMFSGSWEVGNAGAGGSGATGTGATGTTTSLTTFSPLVSIFSLRVRGSRATSLQRSR